MDDSPDLLRLLRLLLSHVGTVEVVAEAADGIAGLEAIERLEPDLVIMDLQMPGLDGIELTRAVRRQHPRMPIVLLTAFAGPEVAADAAEAGVSRLLSKQGDLTTKIPEVVRELEASPLR